MAAANKKTGFDAPAVVLGTLAVLIFVFALGLFMQGGFLKAQDLLVEERVYQADNPAAAAAQAEQQDLLDQGYRWVDKENGTVGMPIEDAKRLVVEKQAAAAE